MTIARSKTTPAVAVSISQQLNTSPAPTPKPDKKRLVAQWLLDENAQLYCKWVNKE